MDFCSSFERHIASQFWVNSKTDSKPKHDNNHRNKRGRERKTEGEQQNHNKDQPACLDYWGSTWTTIVSSYSDADGDDGDDGDDEDDDDDDDDVQMK